MLITFEHHKISADLDIIKNLYIFTKANFLNCMGAFTFSFYLFKVIYIILACFYSFTKIQDVNLQKKKY